PASASTTEAVAVVPEAVELGHGVDAAGTSVPVASSTVAGGLGQVLVVRAGTPRRDGGSAGRMSHGERGGKGSDEEKDDL
ncbi:hypothetical protein BGZ82_002478, partial [Podila clonocystis]